MADKKINFTKAALTGLSPAEDKSRTYVYDNQVNGLGISITKAGTKSFFVYRKVNGKPVRVTLGRFPDKTVEKARIAAIKTLGDIAEGINPIEEKRSKKVSDITLAQVLDDYLSVRGHNLATSTKSSYRGLIEKHLALWLKKPLAKITRDMVAKQHKEISQKSQSAANTTMRILRALFNFANGQYEDKNGRGLFPDNPVSRLTHTRSWNAAKRRDNRIKNTELKAWCSAVLEEAEKDEDFSQVASDYLMFLLLTGLRRREAANLAIEDIDVKENTFIIRHTKNKKPLTLPMSDYVKELLCRRCRESSNNMVFDSSGESGRIDDPRRIISSVREKSEIYFTIHDLRRTFISIAESLDIPAYALKRLVNHSTGSDVTAGYIIMDVERLKKPMQKITDFILKTAEVKQPEKVVSLDEERQAQAIE